MNPTQVNQTFYEWPVAYNLTIPDSQRLLRVMFRISPPGLEELAGGTLTLPNGTTVFLDGSGVPVMWDLRDALNLSLEVKASESWHETWIEVVKGEADIGVPLRTVDMNLGRASLNSIYLLQPVLAMPSKLYFRQPFTEFDHQILTKPFASKAILMLFLCWALCTFACYTIQYFHYSRMKYEMSKSDVLVWGTVIVTGRNYPQFHQRPISITLAMLFSLLFGLLTSAFYSAKIVVFFSIDHKAIQKPEDLLDYGYKLASFSTVHVTRLFENARNKEALADKALSYFASIEYTTINKLLDPNDRFAFLAHSDAFSYIDPNYRERSPEFCALSVFTSHRRSQRSMYISKQPILREALNYKIIQLIERGFNFRYQKNHQRLYEYTCMEQEGSFEKLNLHQTCFIFFILVFGAIVAILIEIVTYAMKNKNQGFGF